MKINQENSDKLNAVLSIIISPDDYQEKIDQKLKDYKRSALIPGFRKGKAPMGIIVRKYRTPLVIEEVNKIIQSNLYKYINEEKIHILGSPIPKEKKDIDWEQETTFTFDFDIGLAPEIKLQISSKKDKLDYFIIKSDKEMIDNYILDITKRFGKMTQVDISSEGDLIFCQIDQIDREGKVIEDGIKNEATVSMEFISDAKIKKRFIGVNKDDVIRLNILEAFSNHADIAAMLNIDRDNLENLSSKEFQFTIKNISNLQPAELDIDLFDKVYGKGEVKNEKDFRERIIQESEKSFVGESDRMLKNDVVNYLINKVKFNMPDDFLKRWLVYSSEEGLTLEKVEEEYDMYEKSLRWQLIENKILDIYDIKVNDDEVKDYAKSLIEMQMKQYGQPIPSGERMNEIAQNILQKDEERKKVYQQIYDSKTLKVYKENFKLNEKTISYDDFVKLASEK